METERRVLYQRQVKPIVQKVRPRRCSGALHFEIYPRLRLEMLVFTLRHIPRLWTKTIDCQSDSFVLSTSNEVISLVISISMDGLKTTST